MSRTSADAVKLVLMSDYGPTSDGSLPDLTPFIDTAAALIDDVATCAAARGVTLDATRLELIERWLAAHCYVASDQAYSARATASASGTFQGQTTMYLEGSKYGQMAMSLDKSGCLQAIGSGGGRKVAKGAWLGKPPSEWITYEERD